MGISTRVPKGRFTRGCVITTDRNLIARRMLWFSICPLPSVMEDEIDKQGEGQLWVGWSLECEENYSWTKDPRVQRVLTYGWGYHQEDDIVYPYYGPDYGKMLVTARREKPYKKKACMFISSDMNRVTDKSILRN